MPAYPPVAVALAVTLALLLPLLPPLLPPLLVDCLPPLVSVVSSTTPPKVAEMMLDDPDPDPDALARD